MFKVKRSSHNLHVLEDLPSFLSDQLESTRPMGSDEARGRVLVLKDPRNQLENCGQRDSYEVALEIAGYAAHFLPVLSHKLVNLDKIARVLTAKDQESFGASQDLQGRSASISAFAGVIFTSQRAVEAWAEAGKVALQGNVTLQTAWQSIPFYAVGPATASALLRLDSRLRPPSSLVLGANETGNAIRLASFIASHLSSKSAAPLLYLSGDKRKDTLESLLKEQGVRLHEIQAYETFQSPTFEEDYRRVQLKGPFEWSVFFSPSGAKMLLPLLERESNVIPSPQIAAIGPTTRDYLLSQNMKVAAMAECPNPDALVKAMLSARFS